MLGCWRPPRHTMNTCADDTHGCCSTVVLAGFTCPATTVGTVVLRALDRVRERACFALAQHTTNPGTPRPAELPGAAAFILLRRLPLAEKKHLPPETFSAGCQPETLAVGSPASRTRFPRWCLLTASPAHVHPVALSPAVSQPASGSSHVTFEWGARTHPRTRRPLAPVASVHPARAWPARVRPLHPLALSLAVPWPAGHSGTEHPQSRPLAPAHVGPRSPPQRDTPTRSHFPPGSCRSTEPALT